jgi:DNA replication protein DnaC
MQAEADHRQERKAVNRIKAAKFTVRSAFEDFDFTAERSITKAQIKEIYTLGWLNDEGPLLLIGETEVGKTFIAQAVGLHACESGKSALYMSITALQENLGARSSENYLRYRTKLAKFDLIIFDEMGMRKLTATEAQDLCEIISETSIDKSIAFTSQLPVDHWNEVIPDTVIFDAIGDRLEHSAHPIKITGPTYRGRQSSKTCLKEKGGELSTRGSAGNPCRVGPLTRNRRGPLREIVQSNTIALTRSGWRVILRWKHQQKEKPRLALQRLRRSLNGSRIPQSSP